MVRVETADGITGLPAGTGVKLVRPGVYLTPTGEAPLDETKLTNDMAKAREALAVDRNAQAALKVRNDAQAQQTAQTQAAQQAQSGTSNTGNSDQIIAAQREQISAQIVALPNQRDAIQAKISEGNKRRSEMKMDSTRRTYQPIIESSTLPDQLRGVDAQIRDLKSRLSLLKK